MTTRPRSPRTRANTPSSTTTPAPRSARTAAPTTPSTAPAPRRQGRPSRSRSSGGARQKAADHHAAADDDRPAQRRARGRRRADRPAPPSGPARIARATGSSAAAKASGANSASWTGRRAYSADTSCARRGRSPNPIGLDPQRRQHQRRQRGRRPLTVQRGHHRPRHPVPDPEAAAGVAEQPAPPADHPVAAAPPTIRAAMLPVPAIRPYPSSRWVPDPNMAEQVGLQSPAASRAGRGARSPGRRTPRSAPRPWRVAVTDSTLVRRQPGDRLLGRGPDRRHRRGDPRRGRVPAGRPAVTEDVPARGSTATARVLVPPASTAINIRVSLRSGGLLAAGPYSTVREIFSTDQCQGDTHSHTEAGQRSPVSTRPPSGTGSGRCCRTCRSALARVADYLLREPAGPADPLHR